ncbi:haloacid dehalogenase superfamily, subfamily IA, variant 3 with third motif having DD or ED/haloacid dehalogenase superfamily, subfamily IA, variant 1 with third motif having Dx(3-4)D or Dx(3-4)E [Lachnospiraceae bacterium NE2001]|jgi:DNA helicase-2/ATP-dependent DNA helicase PcrA|nr:haloacid dehalogenase superfamily, subfamily IA, variant 3 with third motif having DD or ED/haloacid dehalogenase superfamily, subfamily IA, variant 1 with third motif having Dx(3-4)D or Dx(3-4)E [Lachnospiraceae bacterium NE2001]
MQRFKAVVFDMDGVILDSEKIYRRFEYVAAEKYGLPMDNIEEFCNRIAGGTKYTNKVVFQEFFNTDIDYMEYRDVVSAGVEAYAAEHGYEVKPGIKELFEFLKEKDVKIALATSTDRDRATRFLEPHGLLPYFDAMVFGDSIKPGRGKPNPDIYLAACEKLGTEPAETIGVEDSRNGVISSSRGGLYTVMVLDLIPPDEIVREYADQIYENAYEITNLF